MISLGRTVCGDYLLALTTAALAAFLGGCRASAPTLSGAPPLTTSHFLDQSYIFLPESPPRLLYEAQLAPNIFLMQDLSRADSAVRRDTTPQWHQANSLAFTPMFVIRQLDDSSGAVRTPSFMPKVTYQRFWVKKSLKDFSRLDPGDRSPTNPRSWSHVNMQTLDIVFSHYSNGQAGCFYENQRRRSGDFECEWIGQDSTVRRINTSDGSFSTWFARLGYGYERLWVSGAAGAPVKSSMGGFGALSYLIPAMTEEPQRELYGSWRARALLEGKYHSRNQAFGGTSRVAMIIEHALDAGPGVPRNSWSAEASHAFTRAYGIGAFARYRAGQEYYNIGFTETLNVWQFGLTINQDRPDHFNR